MTLEEAKTADKILKIIYDFRDKRNESIAYKAVGIWYYFSDDIKIPQSHKYIHLIINDGYLIPFNSNYKLSDSGIAFLLFKGGYTKMVKDQKKEKSKETTKYWFDIAKDILLIILAIVSVVISIIYAEN